MADLIHKGKKRTLTVTPIDIDGNAAPVEEKSLTATVSPVGGIQVTVINETTVTVSYLAPGKQTVSLSADADLGAGVRTITWEHDFETVTPDAESLDVKVGDEEPE